MEEFKRKRVFVTGASGFFGKHLVKKLQEAGATVMSRRFDLTNKHLTDATIDSIARNYDYIFHLAGYNGGIKFNKQYAFDIFSQNTNIANNIVRACIKSGIGKFVGVVASCAYPTHEYKNHARGFGSLETREVMVEDGFLDGPPHSSVACHGYAKRNLQLAVQFAKQQHGLNGICVCPTTLYGPGDTFDPDRTKVMGAMVRRFVDAADDNLPHVECWGTGAAMREFLYVEDAVKMTMQAALKYNDATKPLNLGSGQECSIKALTNIVAVGAGYEGEIRWNGESDGQLRKRLDLTQMHQVIGEQEYTSIVQGVAKTVEYYRSIKQEGKVAL